MIEINNREDWKKGVKTFLENVTVPYDKEYKWPPAIYNENGDIFFQFNEYIDYIPNERNIMTSSEEEKNDITKLFNLDSFANKSVSLKQSSGNVSQSFAATL